MVITLWRSMHFLRINEINDLARDLRRFEEI